MTLHTLMLTRTNEPVTPGGVAPCAVAEILGQFGHYRAAVHYIETEMHKQVHPTQWLGRVLCVWKENGLYCFVHCQMMPELKEE